MSGTTDSEAGDSRRWGDLHLHSNHSDGFDPPACVMQRAAEMGCSCVALTDHDTVTGLEEAFLEARRLGIDFIHGVEISASYTKFELHVVGLGVDPECPLLLDALDGLRRQRDDRAAIIVDKLQGLGLDVSLDRVRARTANGTVGRMHIAQELHDMGVTRDVQDGFDRYIGKGRSAFVRKRPLSTVRAIELIHEARGVAILAHPGVGNTAKMLMPRLLKLPFDGIEVYHSKHTAGEAEEFRTIAETNGLLVSGGSDCHGSAKGTAGEMGKVRLPWRHVAKIKRAIEERKNQDVAPIPD